MKVTVIGGGGIGGVMTADFSLLEGVEVILLSGRSEKFKDVIRVVDMERCIEFDSNPITVTSDHKIAIRDADMILCTVPADAREECIEKISPFLKSGSYLGFVPGCGGSEFMCRELIDKGVIIFGIQRTPYNSLPIDYGKTYRCKARKRELYFSAVVTNHNPMIGDVLESLFNVPCIAMNNFMEIAFVPANAILHTSRVLTLFKDYKEGVFYDRIPFLYLEWENESSERLLACDEDLQEICREYNAIDLSGIRFIKEHYESNSAEELTAKLQSIPPFKTTVPPMLKTENGYIPNLNARYFTEDFPFGVVNLKGFASIAKVPTPALDELLYWFQSLSGKEYFTETGELGKDINNSSVPQKYGFATVNNIIKFYLR